MLRVQCALLATGAWLLTSFASLTEADAGLAPVGTPVVNVHADAGPGGLVKVDMESHDLAITEPAGTVVFTSDLNQLEDKNVALRTQHMREEFQASQYPKVILTVQHSDLRFPIEGQTINADAPGQLTIHGATRPVQLHYTATRTENTYDVTGTLPVDYTQFLGRKITRFGVSVQPPVTIAVHTRLSDAPG